MLQSSGATAMAAAELGQQRKDEARHEESHGRGQSRQEAHPNATLSSSGSGKSWRGLNSLSESGQPAAKRMKLASQVLLFCFN